MKDIFHYFAFGFTVSSEIELPELVVYQRDERDETPAEIFIRHGALELPAPQSSSSEFEFSGSAEDAFIHWDQFATFRVSHGREITMDVFPGVDDPDLRLPLLGVIMATVLIQRGCFVLHASSVAINGRAAIFLGNKGQGKSTMAATLYGRGHELLSDDLVVIQFGADGQKSIIPGFPQFKLWPDSARSALNEDPEQLPRLAEQYEKRDRRASERFATHPVALGRIYVLAMSETTRIAPMTSGDALTQLIAHSYISRFGKNLLHGTAATRHLRACSDLITHVPPQRLERHRALDELADVALLVETDVAFS